MIIIREGKEIELTPEELEAANVEFVKNSLKSRMEKSFDFPSGKLSFFVEQAYDIYCRENKKTEFDCIVSVYEDEEDKKPCICPGTCERCFSLVDDIYCDYRQEDIQEYDTCCDHLHADTIKKVFCKGEFEGYYHIDNYETRMDELLALSEILNCKPEEIVLKDTI